MPRWVACFVCPGSINLGHRAITSSATCKVAIYLAKDRKSTDSDPIDLTRYGKRIEALLLLSTIAAFASWLIGMACEAAGLDQWLAPYRSRRRLYSVMRLGREALVRQSSLRLSELIAQIRHPSPQLLDQLGVPA